MKNTEAQWNVVLNQYLRESKFYCYYELKATELNSFAFGKIRRVQWDGLQSTEKSGLVWKFSDEISRPKPMDGQNTPPLPSYLVIKFKDGFYFLRIGDVVALRDTGIIGISHKQAEQMAEKIIKI